MSAIISRKFDKPKIVVIGSCNIDVSAYVPYLPKAGETLQADKMLISHGGKGANQCVAAARLGASTAMIGRLGGDAFGKHYLEDLKKNGVNTDFVTISHDVCSGTAVITVAKNGDNQIIIVPGANGKVCKDDISKAASFIKKADVVVFQFETPIDATVEALKLLQKEKVKSIVNAAPAVPNPDGDVFKLSDIFCVNETEAEILTGVAVSSIAEAEKAVHKLLEKGCKVVILTLGAQGVVFASKEAPTPMHVPAKEVTAVDTTGAGDAFIGALAYYLAYHPAIALEENIRRCCEIAAVTIQTPGAQPSFPHHQNLPDNLFK